MSTSTYTTIDQVVDEAIRPALGEYAHYYDLPGIAASTYAYHVDTDRYGRELISSERYVRCVDDATFWAVVAGHETA